MSFNVWLAFLVTSTVIAISPGPSAVLSISTGLRHGFGRSLIMIAGLEVALVIHLAVVAVGLGAVLAASSTVFFIVKVVGALYLIWLGIQRWRAPVAELSENVPVKKENVFLQGLLVNLTNPKALVFIVALVPQFIDPAGDRLSQFSIIGATMIVADILVMSAYALLAGRCRNWLHNPRMLKTQNRIFGGLFVSAGALLAASSR